MHERRQSVSGRRRVAFVLVGAVCLTVATLLATAWEKSPLVTPASTPSTELVSVADGTGMLQRAVAIVAAGRTLELCKELGGGNGLCDDLRRWPDNVRAAPTTMPMVVGVRKVDGSTTQPPAIVLEVNGIDQLGRPYRSDFYVVRAADGRLAAPYPVFWTGLVVGAGR